MSSKNIKGITIEVDGKTTGLQNALKDVNSQSQKVNKELKEVDRLLKFNPGNAEGIAQKQKLLANQISNTTDKLNTLKDAQASVEAQFNKGEIGEEQYRAFRRELETTEGALNGYKGQLANLENSQESLGRNTQRLETFFKSTGSSVDDFSDILGTRLTNSIKDGTATSEQLEMALNKIARASLGAEVDVNELKDTLDKVDDHSGIDLVTEDIKRLSAETDKTGDSLGKLTKIVSADLMMDVADKLGQVSDKIIEIGSDAIKTAADVAASNAQFTQVFGEMETTAQATVESLGEQFGILPNRLKPTYSAIASQMMSLGFDTQKAMDISASATTAAADAAAFYDISLEDSAGRVQSFLKGNLSAAEGIGLFASVTTLNSYAVDKLGQEYSKMDEKQKQALRMSYVTDMQEKAKVTGQAAREMDGYENIVGNASSAMKDFKSAIGENALEMFSEILMEVIPLIQQFADWFRELNPVIKDIIVIIAAVVAVIGTLLPILVSLGAAAAVAEVSILALVTGTILPAIGVIAAVVAAITAVIMIIKNWGAITDWLGKKWDELKEWLSKTWDSIAKSVSDTFDGIADYFTGIWKGITSAIKDVWLDITSWLSETWKSIVTIAKDVWQTLTNVFTVVFMTIQAIIEGVWTVISSLLQVAWEHIVWLATTIFTPIIDFFSGIWNEIASFATELWEDITEKLSSMWEGIVAVAESIWTPLKEFFINTFTIVLETVTMIWTTMTDFLTEVWNGIVAVANSIWTPFSEFMINLWTSLTDFLIGTWEVVSETAISIWQTITEFLAGVWESIKSTAISVWESLMSFLFQLWEDIKNKVTSIFNSMKEFISGVWSSIKESTSNTWNNIKESMVKPINEAKDKIAEVIDAIKGFFKKLVLKFPKIEMPKLPHFSMKGKFSLNPPSVPKLDVDWFAKGGIMTKPTFFGMNGNRVMGGGEAGPEAIAPIAKLMDYVRTAVSEANDQKEVRDEIHLHLTAIGNLSSEMIEQMAEELIYKIEEIKQRKNPFGGVG